MNLFSVFAIAFALSVDAFAVALTSGIRMPRVTLSRTLRVGGVFGGFQFLMPLIGWFLGAGAHQYIEQCDHWIAFGLLVFVGGRMIWEAWSNKDADTPSDVTDDLAQKGTLLLLGIATSLDALAVGLSFQLLDMEIWLPAVIVGVVCFFISAAGLHLGRLATRLPGLESLGNKANALGGIVLWIIGIHILLLHGVFN